MHSILLFSRDVKLANTWRTYSAPSRYNIKSPSKLRQSYAGRACNADRRVCLAHSCEFS